MLFSGGVSYIAFCVGSRWTLTLCRFQEAILRGAPRLSDIIEKINPLMLAEMHANFMAAKISKNEGSEGANKATLTVMFSIAILYSNLYRSQHCFEV